MAFQRFNTPPVRTPETLTVVATKDPVPVAGMRRIFITDEPAEVPATAYYRRRIADGELRVVETKANQGAPAPAAKKQEVK